MPAPVRIRSRASVLQVLRDPQRKSLPRIAWEAAAFWREKQERPHQYFQGLLYRKGIDDPQVYLGRDDRGRLDRLIMRPEASMKLRHKHLFDEHFSGALGVRLPRHLGYTEGGVFRAADETERPLGTEDDLRQLVDRLLDDVSAHGGDSFFAKPTNSSRGRGIVKVTSPVLDTVTWRAIQGQDYVFQQTVAQHPALSAVAPDSLNTMRVVTVRRDREEPEVAAVMMRFGRRGGATDNASAGGLIAGVDLATGRLARFCGTLFGSGGETFTHHPDTGHPLLGDGIPAFEIPKFEAGLEMARAAARHTEYPLVGWDVAIAPDGPVLIEGNFRPDYNTNETVSGAYATNPVFGPYIQELTGGRGLGPASR